MSRVEAEVCKAGAGRDPDLTLDQIDTVNFLGDGMLNLKPGIDFDKGEIAWLRGGIDQKLERPIPCI